MLVGKIHRLKVTDGAELRVPRTEVHQWVMDADGGTWARKRVVTTGVEGLLAEAISWLLARRLGVPCPDAAVTVEGDLSWLSRQVAPVTHWHPIHQGCVTNMMDLGRILVLDVLVNNSDRHAGNLLLQPEVDESVLKLWAIDAGNALIGWPDDYAAARDELPSVQNLARGLPVREVYNSAIVAAEVATTIASDEILSMISEACEISGEHRSGVIYRTLLARCAHARDLTERYLTQIGARR